MPLSKIRLYSRRDEGALFEGPKKVVTRERLSSFQDGRLLLILPHYFIQEVFRLKKVAVLGATGYTGIELLRILLMHPEVEPVFISSESRQGEKFSRVHPQFTGVTDLTLSPQEPEAVPEEVEAVFCALPHGRSAEVVKRLREKNLRVVDLSADFRLKDPSLYREWYGMEHPFPGMLQEAVYGLPEINRREIESAGLVANPGCYPTSVLLALAPPARHGLLEEKGLVVDSKSGVSGAGRVPKQGFHFPECSESFKAYRVASHQHTPEMEQELSGLNRRVRLLFTPHLIPVNRGIISTAYHVLKGVREGELRELYHDYYREAVFVKLLEEGVFPETRWVRGTNYCHINLRLDKRTGTLIVVSAIDNLVKGASGQAVQNMNLMLGLSEEAGLQHSALVP